MKKVKLVATTITCLSLFQGIDLFLVRFIHLQALIFTKSKNRYASHFLTFLMIILSNALLRGEFDLTNLIIITIPIPYLFAHDPIKITLYLIALNLITQIIGLMILSIDQNELFSYILVCIIIGVSSSYQRKLIVLSDQIQIKSPNGYLQTDQKDSFDQSRPVSAVRRRRLFSKLQMQIRRKNSSGSLRYHTEGSESGTPILQAMKSRSDIENAFERTPSLNNSSFDSSQGQVLSDSDIRELLSILQEVMFYEGQENLTIREATEKAQTIKEKFMQAINTPKINNLSRFNLRSFEQKIQKQIIEVDEGVYEYLELNMGKWDFDTLLLLQHTQNPLFDIGYFIFTRANIVDYFKIDDNKLKNFLQKVESSYYRQNYYHNSAHAADVTCSTIFLTRNGLEIKNNSLTDLDIFSMIISAMCHDVQHPGVNNAFLVATQNELALKYNDQSVLENMHCNFVFSLLQQEQYNIIEGLSKEQAVALRKIVVETILATDLQKHFNKLNEFNKYIDDSENLTLDNEVFRHLILQIIIKCSDIGHGAKELSLHCKWSSLIILEFFQQGDRERQLGIPVSPLCDKSQVMIPSSQKGFLSVLVSPLYEAFERAVIIMYNQEEDDNEFERNQLEISVCLDNITENIEFWSSESERHCKGMPQNFSLDGILPPLQS